MRLFLLTLRVRVFRSKFRAVPDPSLTDSVFVFNFHHHLHLYFHLHPCHLYFYPPTFLPLWAPSQSLFRIFLATVLRSALTDAGLTVSASTDKADLISLWANNPHSLPKPWSASLAQITADLFSIGTAELGSTSSDPPFPSPALDHSTFQTTLPSHAPSNPAPPLTLATDQALAVLTRPVEDLTTKISEQRNYVDQRFANELLPIISSSLLSEPSSPGLISSLAPSSSASPSLSNNSLSTATRGAVPLPKMDARAEWAYIPPTVFDSAVDGSFEIRDLWKLDPTHRFEIEMAKAVVTDRTLNGLFESLQSIFVFTEQSHSLAKYQSLDDIILPWTVYCWIATLFSLVVGIASPPTPDSFT